MSNPNTDFKITCTVNKAYEFHELSSRETKRRIQGMASGTTVDREGERMSKSVIDSFKRTIKEGIYLSSGEWSYVPLVSEHRKNALGEPQWDQVLGHLVDAWVDDDWNLWIEAELDPVNPNSLMLYEKLTRDPEEGKPKNLGLSIGGTVTDAVMEWDPELKRSLKTYRGVGLREVTVTSAPAFPTRYLNALQKSVNWEKVQEFKEIESMKNQDQNTNEEVVKNEDLAVDEQVAEEVVKTDELADDQAAEDINKEVEEAATQDAVAEQDVEKEQAEVEDAEAVEKAEEQVSEEEDASFVTTDAFESLVSTVGDLAGKFATFADQFEKSISRGVLTDPYAEEAEEGADAGEEEPVEEAAVEEVEEAVEEVVAEEGDEEFEEVIEDEEPETAPVERSLDMQTLLDKLGEMNDKIANLDKTFSARIEELSNEEVDKSIVPSRANPSTAHMFDDESESEFMEVIKSRRGHDAINAAFE